MSETLFAPFSLDLRAELEDMVLRDLLGPAGGPTELVTERNVRGRYVMGLIAPRGQTALPDDDDDLVEGGTDTEDGKAEFTAPRSSTMLPSAIGLTFTVAKDAQAIRITARWGRYERVRFPLSLTGGTQGGPDEESRLVWQRVPMEGTSDPIPLKHGRIKNWSPCSDSPDVVVQGLMRKRDEQWSITLFLVNGQTEPAHSKDSAWLFQPELSVESPDGAAIFQKRPQWRDPSHVDPDDLSTQMLYRQQVEFAVGHGVAVHAERAPGQWDRAMRFSTCVAPVYEMPRVTPPTADEIPALKQVVLDMRALAELPADQLSSALRPLAEAYSDWIDQQAARLTEPADDLRPFDAAARMTIDTCRNTLQRLREGIELLSQNPRAAAAFRFANRAMWQQRVRSTYVREVRQGRSVDLDAVDVPANRTWYPFQLAFILINLPALTDPRHPDRGDSPQAIADVLWFPTGGGKTEAYLGLTAYTLGIRRLQDDVVGYSGKGGVAVLMRYTLRLLTLQQFQRAAALMCACELIRREDPIKWGDEPFRIGLWVGQRSTPNRTEDAAEILRQGHGLYSTLGGIGTPYQLTNCPWCGTPITINHLKAVPWKKGAGRTFMYCGDKLGRCPFTERQAPDEGLPAIVVDEEIYRRLPALVIATVDKFAQLPWKGETQMLFGKVNGWCPRHGYRSPEIEDSDSHPAQGKSERVKTQPCGPLRPPDLIIQDELHLISGPLGTLVGLYETAIDQLASWQIDGQIVRPKVIASSATIRKAPEQVHGLYLRRASIFPPSGIDVVDNFFARQREPDTVNFGRRYLGICAAGQRLRTVLIRVYVAYLSAAQQLYERYGQSVDPWMTLVGYFNSMRELGGMRRAVEDAVRSRARRMADRGLANRYVDSIEELTSRKSAADIPQILDRLESVFDPVLAAERKQKRRAGETTSYTQYPIDVLLATNMISVGVDVLRLGLMVVAGQPKTTAEYIQATSRIGRHFPGLVCVVYNWARPRDLSHYERFEHYHATFYQHVEALSVTPFSSRALDRGLPALLVANVRLPGTEFNSNDGAGRVVREHPYVATALDRISRRAGLVTSRTDVAAQVQQELKSRLDQWLARAQAMTGGAQLGYEDEKDGRTIGLLKRPVPTGWELFTCLNSLRDVEPSINLILRDHGMDRDPEEPLPEEPSSQGNV